MGSLKQLADPFGLVTKVLGVLGAAGFNQQDLESLTVEQAVEMHNVLRPVVAPSEVEIIPPMPKGMSTEQQLARWVWIYRHKFGIVLDVAKIKIPKRRRRFDRLIIVATDKLEQIFGFCRGLFSLWLYNEAEMKGITSIRTCKDGAYAVWVRDGQEADTENLDRRSDSFDQVDCVTLQERLFHEIVYFVETGNHLDVSRFTLCAGSRYSDGDVPHVLWSVGLQAVRVYWYCASAHDPDFAVRSAVSL